MALINCPECHFGQTGTIQNLYRHHGIDANAIVAAAHAMAPGPRCGISGWSRKDKAATCRSRMMSAGTGLATVPRPRSAMLSSHLAVSISRRPTFFGAFRERG